MSGLVYLLVLRSNRSSGSFDALKKSTCIKLLSFSLPSPLSEYPDEQENECSQQLFLNTAYSQLFLPCRKTAFDQHPLWFWQCNCIYCELVSGCFLVACETVGRILQYEKPARKKAESLALPLLSLIFLFFTVNTHV